MNENKQTNWFKLAEYCEHEIQSITLTQIIIKLLLATQSMKQRHQLLQQYSVSKYIIITRTIYNFLLTNKTAGVVKQEFYLEIIDIETTWYKQQQASDVNSLFLPEAKSEQQLSKSQPESEQQLNKEAKPEEPIQKPEESKQKPESPLKDILQHCITTYPENNLFWLLSAKIYWYQFDDIHQAIKLLTKAISCLPDDEDLYIALAKLLCATKQTQAAKQLLSQAIEQFCTHTATYRLIMKYILILRSLWSENHDEHELTLSLTLDQAIKTYPKSYQFYLIKSDFYQQNSKKSSSFIRQIYKQSIKILPHQICLWLQYATYERSLCNFNKSRSILELIRQQQPNHAQIWIESFYNEYCLLQQQQSCLLTSLTTKFLQLRLPLARVLAF